MAWYERKESKYTLTNRKVLAERLLKYAEEHYGVTADEFWWKKEGDREEWKQWCIKRIKSVMQVEGIKAELEFDMFDLAMGPSLGPSGKRGKGK